MGRVGVVHDPGLPTGGRGAHNMAEIVAMWLKASKRQYQDVSGHTLLPFSGFREGVFVDELPETEGLSLRESEESVYCLNADTIW